MKRIEWMTNFKVESYLKRDFPLHTFDQYFKLKKKNLNCTEAYQKVYLKFNSTNFNQKILDKKESSELHLHAVCMKKT